ncbi:MAG: FkbM family methyltransferase [Alphaproteobacteria bacterium]|nr:FkbM family methyltransferase [Alphaproteobacteria bacterium]
MLQKIKSKLRRTFRPPALAGLADLVTIDHRVSTVTLGSRYGSWTIPEPAISEGSRCYLFGAGEDISFDVALIRRFGVEAHVFDPTPRAKTHVEGLIEATRAGRPFSVNNDPGISYEIETADLEKLHFHGIGIWSKAERLRFYAPANPEHVSHSAVNLQRTASFFEAEVQPLDQIMRDLGHDLPDLVKLDVEGAEYQALGAMLDANLLPALLLVEFDEGNQPLDDGATARIQNQIEALRQAGYGILDLSGWNACFFRLP